MSFSIDQVNATADTFQVWVDQTNKAINAISTICVTVNTHASGGSTTGNGYVVGIFGASIGAFANIRGGTVAVSANLQCTSNLVVNGGILVIGNVAANTTDISINGFSIGAASQLSKLTQTTTTGTSAQEVNSLDKIVWRGADFNITIKDNNANAYQVSKLLLVHDSGNGYFTEYSDIYSNTNLGTFSCNANSTHIRLYVTPTSTNTKVTGTRLTLEV